RTGATTSAVTGTTAHWSMCDPARCNASATLMGHRTTPGSGRRAVNASHLVLVVPSVWFGPPTRRPHEGVAREGVGDCERDALASRATVSTLWSGVPQRSGYA